MKKYNYKIGLSIIVESNHKLTEEEVDQIAAYLADCANLPKGVKKIGSLSADSELVEERK